MWPEFLARVTITGALPIEFMPSDLDAAGRETVRVSMVVPDTDTSADVMISRALPLPRWRGERAAAMWVRDQVRWLYRHEADEQVQISGRRVFLPHHEHATR
jgi:hypothetical protein